ncbi:mesogenin-1-like [Hoplias malabaricus]|uniref:mesogenin-1-like n=1 Tax=Hoplias malabaricus TaxID=27720 RepID=UPI0034620642
MDPCISPIQLQENSAFLFNCENLLNQSYTASDSGYYSGCSSLSPASSTDSCCFSPPSLFPTSSQETCPESFPFKNDQEDTEKAKPARRTGRPRSKCPGVKRQSASEREKLRMRDLTKALHHLRTYLPPSVAPAGQTLTKIETLRLTIRYISHLSAQLEYGNAEGAHGVLPGCSGHMEAPSPAASEAFHQENVCQVSLPAQSFSAQEFTSMPSYQNAECALPLSPVEDYWFPQQPYSYYGQC